LARAGTWPICPGMGASPLTAIPHSHPNSLARDKLKKVLTMIKLLPSASHLSLISSYLGYATR
jgi:hypothetical protein